MKTDFTIARLLFGWSQLPFSYISSAWHPYWLPVSLALLKMLSEHEHSKTKAAKPECNLRHLFVNVFGGGRAVQFSAQFPLKFFVSGFQALPCQVIQRKSFLSTKSGWKRVNRLVIKVCLYQEKTKGRADSWVSRQRHGERSPRGGGVRAALHCAHLAADLPSS